MRINLQNLEHMLADLDEMGNLLAGPSVAECLDQRGSGTALTGSTCIRREGGEHGQRRRSYDQYREDKLCAPCAAFWHVSRARVLLLDLKALAAEHGKPVRS